MALGGKKKPRYVFLAFLLVLLAVSAFLTFFVYRYADDFFNVPQATRRQMAATGPAGGGYRRPGIAHHSSAVGWRGTVEVRKVADGENEVKIIPLSSEDELVPLTSFQVYLRGADGKEEEDVSAQFARTAGALKGTLKGKAAGPYALRIRLHRRLSTLEFTERVTLQ